MIDRPTPMNNGINEISLSWVLDPSRNQLRKVSPQLVKIPK